MLSSIASTNNEILSPTTHNEKMWWIRSDVDSQNRAKKTERVMREGQTDELNTIRKVNSDTDSINKDQKISMKKFTSPVTSEAQDNQLLTNDNKRQLITIQESKTSLEEYQADQHQINQSLVNKAKLPSERKVTSPTTFKAKNNFNNQEPRSFRLIKKTIQSSKKMAF